ncbi:MAG: 50S ribosomal protein L24 [Patescibacteria group bacterium]
MKYHLKKGDEVKILAGKDKGKTGKITQVLPSMGRAVVEGCNQLVKHLRRRREGEKGQRIEFFAPLPISNLAVICQKCKKVTRIRMAILEGEKKTRSCIKCQQTL